MPYKTDMTDDQYSLISDIFTVGNYGSARKHSVRALINAVFYLNKTGCHWYLLPNDFPPYKTVYTFYRRAIQQGKWDEMLKRLVQWSRMEQGRSPDPSYALIDAQSVKTTHASEARGFDGGKKSKGS